MLKTLLRRLLPSFVRIMVSLLTSAKADGLRPVRINFSLKDARVLVILSPGFSAQNIQAALHSISDLPGMILIVSPNDGGKLREKLEKLLA